MHSYNTYLFEFKRHEGACNGAQSAQTIPSTPHTHIRFINIIIFYQQFSFADIIHLLSDKNTDGKCLSILTQNFIFSIHSYGTH